MINGAHIVIYSTAPDADRAFFRDILKLPNVDVGHGWLIFALPPSEVAVHPHDTSMAHELYLMCDDIKQTVADLQKHGVACAEVSDEGWGLLSSFRLPGGGGIGFYQPRHDRPPPAT